MTPITLTVPMPPNLANGRGHSRWIGKQKQRYFAQLDERQNCGLIPPPPLNPFRRAEIRATMRLGAAMDDDNAKYRAYKWPCDWLKTRGYIVDDKRTCLTMHDPLQTIRRLKRFEYDITLTLTPLSLP